MIFNPAWLTLPKRDLIKTVQATPQLGMLRVAVAGALAGVNDADYNYYKGLLGRIITALDTTPEGQAILKEIGLELAH